MALCPRRTPTPYAAWAPGVRVPGPADGGLMHRARGGADDIAGEEWNRHGPRPSLDALRAFGWRGAGPLQGLRRGTRIPREPVQPVLAGAGQEASDGPPELASPRTPGTRERRRRASRVPSPNRGASRAPSCCPDRTPGLRLTAARRAPPAIPARPPVAPCIPPRHSSSLLHPFSSLLHPSRRSCPLLVASALLPSFRFPRSRHSGESRNDESGGTGLRAAAGEEAGGMPGRPPERRRAGAGSAPGVRRRPGWIPVSRSAAPARGSGRSRGPARPAPVRPARS